ncbi:MAG: AAA family ATPase [Desulfovibrio sp.]|jgi:hypothetical protein|nr:AAA family ATPase [Desulfovibrio sp.]
MSRFSGKGQNMFLNQLLPTGTADFTEIREKGALYIDKTKYLVNLIDSGKAYFLSRPRRFGKSLTVSTLESMFKGKNEFFKGLAAEEWFSRENFSPFPVISLDFIGVTGEFGIELLHEGFRIQLQSIAESYNITLKDNLPPYMFYKLVDALYSAFGKKVVILVDEYDHQINDFIDDPVRANEIRKTMQNFLSVIKWRNSRIEFIFVTGITKFSKTGLFSVLNNLNDISLDEDYSAICGCTQEELDKYFTKYVEELAAQTGKNERDVKNTIEQLYYGFSFDGKTYVYNPDSLVNLFLKRKFDNFWFESATPTYIEKFLANKTIICSDYIDHEAPALP